MISGTHRGYDSVYSVCRRLDSIIRGQRFATSFLESRSESTQRYVPHARISGFVPRLVHPVGMRNTPLFLARPLSYR